MLGDSACQPVATGPRTRRVSATSDDLRDGAAPAAEPPPADARHEADLMGRYCDGDVKAFHRLYALVAPKILAYLVGLTADRALAEDLLQHTFLKLHQARGSYVRDANPVPWIYTIAHRT